ncbi:MAG: hypothetical protein ACXVRV_08215 [Gaiellaceae bacterium]
MEIRTRRYVRRNTPAESPDPDAGTERLLALEELRDMGLLSRHEFVEATKRYCDQPSLAAASSRRTAEAV